MPSGNLAKLNKVKQPKAMTKNDFIKQQMALLKEMKFKVNQKKKYKSPGKKEEIV